MMKNSTIPKIEKIKLNKLKPIIVCDADEVIFQFMTTFEKHLKENHLKFNWNSYALSNNILDNKNRPLDDFEIKNVLSDFFDQKTLTMKLVKGAQSTLNNLSKFFEILILSNIPHKNYKLRKRALKENGINFPFVSNSGEKGLIVNSITQNHPGVCWFIDDSPFQIKSVKKHSPSTQTIHFTQNKRLSDLMEDVKVSDNKANTWKQLEFIILQSK